MSNNYDVLEWWIIEKRGHFTYDDDAGIGPLYTGESSFSLKKKRSLEPIITIIEMSSAASVKKITESCVKAEKEGKVPINILERFAQEIGLSILDACITKKVARQVAEKIKSLKR